ncbi:MAG: acetylxylan esterase [Armatimonadetes bacterium]|nr:acetylxylan esterase [Armatimonadota bacterium]
MEPDASPRHPRPAAVVPFYHPDEMAGLRLESGQPLTERPVVQFGRHLVQQGYVVACPEAFPFNAVPEPEPNTGFAWWAAAAARLAADQPTWTGIGKLAHDTSRAVDLLLAQPDIDPGRVVAMGHSLGGKMAFYAGALDHRIAAVIGSDFGIGWDYTNWDAPWYLGERLRQPGFALAHHQLLALLAPRAFFLIVGDTDRAASWQYLQAAQQVYALYDRAEAVGLFAHGTGHAPTEESLRLAYGWLAEQFGIAPTEWSL